MSRDIATLFRSDPALAGAGMRRLDLADSERVPILMEMVGALSRANDPTGVQRAFADGWRRINPIDGYLSLSIRNLPPGEYKITRRDLGESVDRRERHDPWSRWGRMPAHRGGLIGEIIRTAYPEVIHHLDVRDDPVLGNELEPYGSLMAIPLFDDGEPLNWMIVLRTEPEGFSLQELEDSILRSNLVGGTVRNTLITRELRTANARVRQEMERIADIQRSLLPERMPEIPGTALAASYATFDTAGGDLYGFRPALAETERAEAPADSPWCIFIADASGHGPSAAVVIAMTHAIIHAYPTPPEGPAEVMNHVNVNLCGKRIEHSFVTAFFGVYHPTTRRLVYTRAGHEPPIVKDAGSGGPTHRLDGAGGIPLGILEDTVYEEEEIVLDPGQTLVLYTDGITEARDPDGAMLGIEGIEQALIECSGEPDCVVNSILTAVRSHEAGIRPGDDQTIVSLKVLEDGAHAH